MIDFLHLTFETDKIDCYNGNASMFQVFKTADLDRVHHENYYVDLVMCTILIEKTHAT